VDPRDAVGGNAMSIRLRLIAATAAILLPLGLFAVILLAALGASDARTHALYQERLRPTVALNQVVQNFDQMRGMAMQDILVSGSAFYISAQRQAIAIQLETLDKAIEKTIRGYETTARSARQQDVLRSWPTIWKAFIAARTAALLHASTMSSRLAVERELTVVVDNRLNDALDLVFALVAYEEQQGYGIDSAQTAASRHTSAVLEGVLIVTVVIGLVLALSIGRSVGRLYDDVKAQATHDVLTGLLSHRAFVERLDALTSRNTRAALLLIDIDNFKLFNDVYGHQVGDTVLRVVAGVLGTSSRAGDVLARYGGDEFVVLLHDATEEDARAVVARLSAAIHDKPYRTADGALIPVRLSVGRACTPRDGRTRQEILAVAKADLLEAKHDGRPGCASVERLSGGAYAPPVALKRNAADLMGDSAMGILEGLVSAVDAKDSYTREHSEDVTHLALVLATALGLGSDQQRALAIAGPIHDVGKVAVPDRILRKPGKLSDEEYDAIKRHVSYGVALIEGVLDDPLVVDAVAYHHERWDGCGYPHGLSGPKTPLLGRIMQVADAVSAMTLDRPYRQGMPWDEAMEVLHAGAGMQFDPALAEAFIDAMAARVDHVAKIAV